MLKLHLSARAAKTSESIPPEYKTATLACPHLFSLLPPPFNRFLSPTMANRWCTCFLIQSPHKCDCRWTRIETASCNSARNSSTDSSCCVVLWSESISESIWTVWASLSAVCDCSQAECKLLCSRPPSLYNNGTSELSVVNGRTIAWSPHTISSPDSLKPHFANAGWNAVNSCTSLLIFTTFECKAYSCFNDEASSAAVCLYMKGKQVSCPHQTFCAGPTFSRYNPAAGSSVQGPWKLN